MRSGADRIARLAPRAGAWFLFAFALRAAYLTTHGIVVSDDSAAYAQIASNITAHATYSLDPAGVIPTVRYAPVYPLVLAWLQWMGLPAFAAVTWLQAVADAGTTMLVFLLAARVAPLRWASGAAALYALHPGAITASASVLTETSFTFLVVLAVYVTSRATSMATLDRRALAAGGVLLGIAALCRPIALAYVVVVAAVVAAMESRARVAAAAVIVAGAAAVIAPWAWRSSTLAGRFVPVQAASPVLFYLPTRTDWDQRDQSALWPAFARDDEYGRLFTRARTPREMVDADTVGRRLALENIARHPGDYLQSRMKTLPYLVLTSFDSFAGRSQSFGAAVAEHDWVALATKLGLMAIFCVVPLALAAAGASRWPHDLTSALAAALWIATLLLHVPMWIEARFWLPAIPFVLVSAARTGTGRPPS